MDVTGGENAQTRNEENAEINPERGEIKLDRAAHVHTRYQRTLSASANAVAPSGPILLLRRLISLSVVLTCGRAGNAPFGGCYR